MQAIRAVVITDPLLEQLIYTKGVMHLRKQKRIDLAFLPTSVHALPRLSEALGCNLWIKRDDQTGLALGGNKTRKLEYLVADALVQGADTLVTGGMIQSNHCRQTAAAAARYGLRCALLLHADRPVHNDGNVLLDKLFGADIWWADSFATIGQLGEHVRNNGHKPYVIPYGGSNAVGALGYVNAMLEFVEQQKNIAQKITHIIIPSCSRGTQVGLVVGAKIAGFTGSIIGISIDYDKTHKEKYDQEYVDLAYQVAEQLGVTMTFTQDDFDIRYEYAIGYGIVGELEKHAVQFMAQQEGILLDPVYTGRAFGALQSMIHKGEFTRNDGVLFWHTGGASALFAYAKELVK